MLLLLFTSYFLFFQWNSEVLNGNPVVSSFFYSQGNYEPYFEGLNQSANIEKLLTGNEHENKAQNSKKTSKKRKCKLASPSTSYIARRGGRGNGGHLIKLEVHVLKDCKNENNYSDSDNACVSVQYIASETYDEVMDAAQTLIKKIGKKLSDADQC